VDFGHSERRSASKEPFAKHRGCRWAVVCSFLIGRTMPMFHVGLIYKAVTLVWVFMICRHFLLFFRNSPAASRN
jgi:hypothetical protein